MKVESYTMAQGSHTIICIMHNMHNIHYQRACISNGALTFETGNPHVHIVELPAMAVENVRTPSKFFPEPWTHENTRPLSDLSTLTGLWAFQFCPHDFSKYFS
jgi:hypothetical protein